MITLYHGSGSQACEVEGQAMSDEECLRLLYKAGSLLKRRGKNEAANLLEVDGFAINRGTNNFGDEFCILSRSVSLDDYVMYEEYASSRQMQAVFADIATTISEIGPFIRFICVDLDDDIMPQAVASPQPCITSAVVERALIDAEQMVSRGSAVNAVDRAHTALHGYLKQICIDASIASHGDDISLTGLESVCANNIPILPSWPTMERM